MNEQIEQCLYQAGLTAQGCWDELDDYDKQAIEKFAKLIVLECARWLSNREFASPEALKQHFGVKE